MKGTLEVLGGSLELVFITLYQKILLLFQCNIKTSEIVILHQHKFVISVIAICCCFMSQYFTFITIIWLNNASLAIKI